MARRVGRYTKQETAELLRLYGVIQFIKYVKQLIVVKNHSY